MSFGELVKNKSNYKFPYNTFEAEYFCNKEINQDINNIFQK